MKKLVFVVFAVFLTIFLASSVLATDVAYVVKTKADPFLTSELSSAGLTYNVILDSNITSTNFSKYKMILIGNDNFDNFRDIPVEKYNSLIINEYHFYQKGVIIVSDSQWGWSAGRGAASSPTKLKLSTINTTIVDSVPEFFKAYTVTDTGVNTYYLTGKKATGIKLITQVEGHAASDSVLSIAYPGTKYLNGKTGEARSLFFGIVEPKYWTVDSRQLFRNSLEWVLIGEDNDRDGFYTDEDCNDDNAGINPDEEDTAYDEIDQDCDGYDLGDFDEDGYCKLGYEIENALVQCSNELGVLGTDCDDDDAETNPGSANQSLNCVNDVPIISTIPNFIIRESQAVILSVSATDPEGDVLAYYVNDSRFIQSNTSNAFQWQTGFYDAGNHTFMAIASDGSLNATKNFKVEVKDKNQPPELNTTIPTQTWNEDTNLSLNLSDYFYEPDPQDNLTFGVSSTSPDQDITVESILNGIVNFIVKKDWSGFDWIIFFAYDGDDKTESNNVTLTVSPVNDAPVLTAQVPNQTWNEDTQATINLSKYFADVDNSTLAYTVSGNSQVNISFSNNTATLTPTGNWNGQEKIKINAGDGEFNVLSNEINLTVTPVNDAPVLNLISDELLLAGGFVDINPTATDADGDTLSFTFNLLLDNEGKWQTAEQDVGVYKVITTVSDGNGGSDSQEFSIQVLQRFYINELVSNPASGNEWIELYNGFNQAINLSNCVVKDGENNTFMLNGTLGLNGFAVVEVNNKLDNSGDVLNLYCSDKLIDAVAYGSWDDGNLLDNAATPQLGESAGRSPDGVNTGNNFNDFKIFKYPTKGLPNNTDMAAPVVKLSNPQDNSLFTDTRNIVFEFTVTDDLASVLVCDAYLDGNLKETNKNVQNNSAGSILVNGTADGKYTWGVRCYDGRNYAFAPDNRTLNISAPDAPVLNPIGKKSVNENETLQFTVSATDQDLNNVTFSIQNAPEGAGFVDNLGGTAVFSWVPTYEQSGDYEVTFAVRDSTGLSSQEVVKISVNDKRIPPKFTDINLCEAKNSNLEISVKDPDDGDEFEIGEKIGVSAEIKNKHTEDLDVDIVVYLYDVDEEDAVEKEKDSVNINSGKDKTVNFDLAIPEDTENSDFAIFVSAEGKGNGEGVFCNEQFIYVDIQRKEHEIVIKDVVMNQEPLSPGDIFDLTVEVQNKGSEDEDVHVEVKNSELGILKKSEEFELERFGDSDEETMTLRIQVPHNAREGDYDLEIKIVSDETEDSRIGTIYVLRQEETTEDGAVIYEKEGTTETSQQEQSPASIYLALNLFLLMIIAITVAIFRFVKIKK